jgi:predicted O-methyltransferase YrrM
MPQWAWNEIRATLYEYERRFLNSTEYHARDVAAISLWAKAKLRSKVEFHHDSTSIMRGKSPFPTCWDYRKYFQGAFATGQDAMTVLAMTLAGLQKVNTSVNRSQPIGAVGINFSHQAFAHSGLDQITLDVFDDDETRTDFHTVSALRPFMREDESAALRSLIRARRPARILEFGAGGSTIEFSKEEGVQTWCSLEHHGKWSAIVAGELARSSASERVTLICCPRQQYLEQARQLIQQGFDMYFVDGIERDKLLRELAESVRHRPACVLLHDASRAAYQDAMALFPRRCVLTEGDEKHQGLILLEGSE